MPKAREDAARSPISALPGTRLSENTVKNYLVTVFEKLNVQHRTQAAAIYLRHRRS